MWSAEAFLSCLWVKWSNLLNELQGPILIIWGGGLGVQYLAQGYLCAEVLWYTGTSLTTTTPSKVFYHFAHRIRNTAVENKVPISMYYTF